jgi:hypothetical protein
MYLQAQCAVFVCFSILPESVRVRVVAKEHAVTPTQTNQSRGDDIPSTEDDV